MMKKRNSIKSVYFLAIIFLSSQKCLAQYMYPVAISEKGLISDSIISTETAKSILSIAPIYIEGNKPKTKTITEFELLVLEKDDSTLLRGNSAILTQQMRERIKKIKSNSWVIFQGITIRLENNIVEHTRMLKFRVQD